MRATSTAKASANGPDLNPARQRLADHLARIAAAAEAVATAQAPHLRLLRTVEAIEDGLRKADSELAEIEVAEAEDLQRWARAGSGLQPTARLKERGNVAARRAERERDIGAARRALAATQQELEARSARAAELETQTPALVVSVLHDECADSVDRLRAAHEALRDADREVLALARMLSEQGRLRSDGGNPGAARPFFAAAESALAARQSIPAGLPTEPEIQDAQNRWRAFAERLAVDAAAQKE